MKKKIVIPLITLSVIFLIYTCTWYLLLTTTAREFNKQYAGRYINTNLVNANEDYYIKFSKISAAGFPFKIGFKIIGWQEESKVGKIECLEPIYLGYDLIGQNFYGSYAGEALAWHKPLESKFGSKIINEDYSFSIKLPLSFKVLQVLFSSKANGFEIVNFIKNIKLKSGKVQIFDLVNNDRLYDQDYKSLELSFDKRKYYTNLEDFLNNLPFKVEIDQISKINESVFTRRILPPNILFGLNLPFSFSGNNKIIFKINTPRVNDFSKDLEIHYTALGSSSSIHEAEGEIVYKGKINNSSDAEIYLKVNMLAEVKKGFFDKIFDSFKYLSEYVKHNNRNNLILKENKSFEWIASNIIERLNNSTIRELEDHKYQLNLDLSVDNKTKELKTIINELSLFSNKTGIVLRLENSIKHHLNWSVKGLIGLNNQPLIAEFLFKKDILGIFKNYSLEARTLYTEVAGQFLKSISEHSDSTSNDISLDYLFSSHDLKKNKIGKVNAKDLEILFDLALYKEAIKMIGNSESKAAKIQELVPSLDINKQKTLEKFINNPSTTSQDTWNELIK